MCIGKVTIDTALYLQLYQRLHNCFRSNVGKYMLNIEQMTQMNLIYIRMLK